MRKALEGVDIGSDFEEPRSLGPSGGTRPPWEQSDAASSLTYVESGRQALSLVERILAREGREIVGVPEYACDTMLEPFYRRGWKLVPLTMSDELELVPSKALDGFLKADPARAALLMASYFGRPYRGDTLEIQEALSAREVAIIDDLTHRVFSPITTPARFHIASLRKVLPLFDGAFVRGAQDAIEPMANLTSGHTNLSSLRQQAMVAKSKYLTGGDSKHIHRQLFTQAECLVTRQVDPRPMSCPSRARVRQLDFRQIAQCRTENANVVARILRHAPYARILNPPTEMCVPSHLVLVVRDAVALQKYLARNRIYAPIHWPKSHILRDRLWPSTYISLPIDQRYGSVEMTRMAHTVFNYFIDQSED